MAYPVRPTPIDFSPLRPAIAKHLPAGAYVSTMCSTIHFDEQEIESWVQGADAKCHACGSLGHVIAHFRLDGARVVPLAIQFVNDRQ